MELQKEEPTGRLGMQLSQYLTQSSACENSFWAAKMNDLRRLPDVRNYDTRFAMNAQKSQWLATV